MIQSIGNWLVDFQICASGESIRETLELQCDPWKGGKTRSKFRWIFSLNFYEEINLGLIKAYVLLQDEFVLVHIPPRPWTSSMRWGHHHSWAERDVWRRNSCSIRELDPCRVSEPHMLDEESVEDERCGNRWSRVSQTDIHGLPGGSSRVASLSTNTEWDSSIGWLIARASRKFIVLTHCPQPAADGFVVPNAFPTRLFQPSPGITREFSFWKLQVIRDDLSKSLLHETDSNLSVCGKTHPPWVTNDILLLLDSSTLLWSHVYIVANWVIANHARIVFFCYNFWRGKWSWSLFAHYLSGLRGYLRTRFIQ